MSPQKQAVCKDVYGTMALRLCTELHIAVLREIASALEICTSNINFKSSFIENGGDSLSCLTLQSALRNIGIDLTFEIILTTKSVYELLHCAVSRVNNTGDSKSLKRRLSIVTLLPEERGCKRQRRASIVAASRAIRNRSITSLLPEGRYPLTGLQLSFIRSSLSQPRKNIIQYQETHPSERIPRLKQAWHAVVESEPIFRMKFQIEDENGCMLEMTKAHFQWIELAVDEEGEYCEEREKEDWEERLHDGYPVNSFKVVTWRQRSTIIWRVHHALIDEYSRNLLLRKVRERMDGCTNIAGPSFGDFAVQLRLLQCQFQEAGKSHWAEHQPSLAAAATTLSLPPPAISPPKALQHLEIDVPTSKSATLCKRTNITLATFYYAAWALTLSRYADSNNVCFGAVFSGRNLAIPGCESTIGPTINTLPIHAHVDRTLDVEQWLHQVFEQVAKLFSLQWSTPDENVMRRLDTAVNVQLTPEGKGSSPFDPTEPPVSTIMSDIPLQVDIARGGKIRFSYHTSVYSPAQIASIAKTFATTLTALQRRQNTMEECLASLLPNSYLDELSRVGNWNAPTTRKASIKTDLVALFRDAVRMNPYGTAVSRGSQSLTYLELDRKSTVVAERLGQLIEPEDVVCVHADRSIDWIVAMYGVLKARGVYCPFAEDMPAAIKNVNYQTANSKIFLVGATEAKTTKPESCNRCFSVEEMLADATGYISGTARDVYASPRPNAPAYLCFTSGSTGKPKGVLCRHRGLVAFQSNPEVRLFARPNWKIAQVMSPNFDGSIHEIFSALSYGAELVLKDLVDPLAHLKAADSAILTPSVAKVLNPIDYPNLKSLYLVGEAVPQAVCDTWAAEKTLYNMYGPTEATCGATIKQLHAYEPVTLGSPNTTTRIYILDSRQQVVPAGVIGEIYLAGVQVAVGYIGRPDETAKRFLPDTIHPHFDEYMYRTGDRGYWNEAGELMFLGRNDRQIKLRGFRIDMDDLEIRMLQCYPGAKGVAVTLKDHNLVAQVHPASIDMREFRDQVKKHVPAYALPQHILPVDEFPLTPIGKLDYRKIAAHDYSATHVDRHRDTQSPSEKIVATAVRDVLGLDENTAVDLDSTFANLGGHSVLHLHLSHRLSRCFSRRVPLRLILQAPSLRDLAASVDMLKAENVVADEGYMTDSDDSRLSPIEMDWWKKYQQGGSSSFNVSYACELGAGVDAARLQDAWNAVLSRHEILKSYYLPCETFGARRRYHKQAPRVEPVSAMDIHQEIHAPIDISKDYLIRVLVSPTQMLAVISHIICDLTTLRVLLDEVTTAYLGRVLPPIRKSYSQVQWSIPSSSCHFPFWTEYLADQKALQFPVGSNKKRSTWKGTSHVCHIAGDIYTRLRKLSAVQNVTMHQLALAAVALALQCRSDDCDITLGAPYLNRNSEDDQSVVGLFLEPLPIRIQYDSTQPTGESFLQAVQRSSRAALSHAIPWNQLLAHLGITPDFPNHPVLDAMVTFHDKRDSVDFALQDTTPISTWTEGAKFKIMAEFTAERSGGLSLRLEYSTECFDAGDMGVLEKLIGGALDGLAREESYEAIRKRLGEVVGWK